MPFITRPIGPGQTLGVLPATIRTLQQELAANGFIVSKTESGSAQFGADTTARLRDFQLLHGLPVTGALDPATGGVLHLSSLVASENDKSKLQSQLKDAVGKVPNSPEYDYWLARYAIMAGDYQTAKAILHLNSALGDLVATIGGILDPGPQPQAPEVPYPENFYSYREDLVDQDQLAELLSDLQSFTRQIYADYLTRTGHPTDPNTLDLANFNAMVATTRAALNAISAWQTANRFAADREFTLAMQNYGKCQSFVADYFQAPSGGSPLERIEGILRQRRQSDDSNPAFWQVLRWRRILLSLQELADQDRNKTIGTDGAFSSVAAFVTIFAARDEFGTNAAALNEEQRLDPLLLIISTIWVPMAMGEVNSQIRQFDAAIQILSGITAKQAALDVRFRYLCEFIEIPFIRLLTLEALMGKADAEYKAGTTVSPQSPDLLAGQTYQSVLDKVAEDGQYIANVSHARDSLTASVQQAIQAKDTTSLNFRKLGKTMTVPAITSATSDVPGSGYDIAPHQSVIVIDTSSDPRTSNPRVYAIALLATAKLHQIQSGFNYLGYPADYIPPWRFSFLLDRARYFAGQAKNAERDYLNFLNNAEHEEFQEQSLAQNVEMEKSNLRLEAARVDQAQLEVAASQASADLASQQAVDAEARFDNYIAFDEAMQEEGLESSILGGISGFVTGFATGGPALGAIEGGLSFVQGIEKANASQAERDLERENLNLAITEADLASNVAKAKLAVDQQGLVIAGLQFQVAALRHEFAVQNLNFVRSQTLNADQWYRIANAIRDVSDTYLRYAIELGFLAQQAYDFEFGQSIDVIRFDYDLSDVGAMLAADFLLRDLDTLEQNSLVGQQTRQQQVRYVLSMAREFPDTLASVADTGSAFFSMRLEQLERHFPGLYNLRISSVDVQPLALMDPTRVSLELTHLGTGLIRLKSQPGSSPFNTSDVPSANDWLQASTAWPQKIQVTGPDTSIFSGLSRQEAASLSVINTNERGAFEGLPGASSWKIDLSTRENRIIPGTLADVVVTFTLAGFYDADLDTAVAAAAARRRAFAATSAFSARSLFPDAFYSVSQYGRLDWDLSPFMLAVSGEPGNLRNVGIQLPLNSDGVEIGRSYCRYPIELEIDTGGNVKTVSALPFFSLSPDSSNKMILRAEYQQQPGETVEAIWDFGDGSAPANGLSTQHAYSRPGRYEVLTRLVKNGRLDEYRSAVYVSLNNAVIDPLITIPGFSFASGELSVAVTAPVGFQCRLGKTLLFADLTGTVKFQGISAGQRYSLEFTATRRLSVRFCSKQNFSTDPNPQVILNRMRASTNRTFDLTGTETTASPNGFTGQVFGGKTLAPDDRWSLEIPLAQNPCFLGVSSSDLPQFDGSEFADAVITLEYELE